MTIIRVPGAAQFVASRGAIFFSRVEAPLQIRGSQVTLGDMVATGPSVGLTARGIMDTRTRKMDVVGVVTPAYTLNAAFAGLTGSRQGEGIFGITYHATGPFTDPDIEINPLSIAVPGALRRLFEPRTPELRRPLDGLDQHDLLLAGGQLDDLVDEVGFGDHAVGVELLFVVETQAAALGQPLGLAAR